MRHDTVVPHVVVINVYFAPYTYGGATVVAEQVALRLQNNHGFQVSAISAMCRADMPAYSVIKSERDGIANYIINMPADRSYSVTYDNPEVTEVIERILRRIEPDVVHLHCLQDIGVGVLPMLKRNSLPMVLSTHDFWWLCERQFMIKMDGNYCWQDPVTIQGCRGCVDDWERAKSRVGRLKAAAALADVVTFPSEFAKDLSVRSGLTGNRTIVWENGVRMPGATFFEQQEMRRQNSGNRLVFGFVGGPSQIKGWPILRQAFEQISRDDFDGYLVEGSMDGSWWRDLDTSKLKGKWIIHPRFAQEEMDEFYSKIDVLLFMSQWKETFGLTIREALARGIRVIQTDSGGTTEHNAVEPEKLLKIGDGPEKLLPHLEAALDNSFATPEPVKVTDFETQAAEMAECLSELIKNAKQGQR